MAQNDIQITTTPPLSGLTLVENVNDAFQSLATDFAGAIDPASLQGVGPYVTWADTANGLLKRRNAAGTDWVVEGKLLANNSAAENIDYDNAVSGLTADNVQDAVDEIQSNKLDADKNIALGIPVSASGQTAIDFTGIPIGCKRIVISFANLSTNGVATPMIQVGNPTISSVYHGSVSSAFSSVVSSALMGIGHYLTTTGSADASIHGRVEIKRLDSNTWILNGACSYSNGAATTVSSSSVSISGDLTLVRLTTFTGTDQFDTGTVNISWE